MQVSRELLEVSTEVLQASVQVMKRPCKYQILSAYTRDPRSFRSSTLHYKYRIFIPWKLTWQYVNILWWKSMEVSVEASTASMKASTEVPEASGSYRGSFRCLRGSFHGRFHCFHGGFHASRLAFTCFHRRAGSFHGSFRGNPWKQLP